jgi:hypothetical protein
MAVAVLTSTPAVGGQQDGDEFKFQMVSNPGLNAAFPNFLVNARGRVKVEAAGPVEIMDVMVFGLLPQH